jgi:hypothetical protein
LNLIAADLCLKHGMDYQEAVDLWVTVSLGLTAKTDYRQEPELITWALEQTGLADKYQKAVDELVEQTRIDTHEKPEPLPADQQLVTLQLPDTEAFETNDWCLVAYQVNVSQLKTLVEDTISLFTEALENPDALDKLGESSEDFLNNLSLDTSEIESPELVVDEDAVFLVITPGVGPVHVIAVARSIMEDVALALVHLPVGYQAVAVGIHACKARGNLAGGKGTVPHAHFTEPALEELARTVVAPRHTQLKALERSHLARAAGLGILNAIDIHLKGRAVVGARDEIPSIGLEVGI